MPKMRLHILFFSIVLITACADQNNQAKKKIMVNDLAAPPSSWVAVRVATAKNKLQSTEAGQLIWKAIEYQGGLSKWFANGPIYFRFNYRPQGQGKVRDTYQTVDTWSSKARHQLTDNPSVEYGWDGEKAWKYPADAEIAMNPRFWSLTPYYFIGLPFVLGDEGVILTLEEPTTLQGKEYSMVRVTYGEGIGDAPDDYYVLYLDKETSRLAALRYVVSYPGFFPNGGQTAEKLMLFEGSQNIDDITLPERLPTYKWSDEHMGELVTNIDVTNVSFKTDVKNSYFNPPEASYVLKGFKE